MFFFFFSATDLKQINYGSEIFDKGFTDGCNQPVERSEEVVEFTHWKQNEIPWLPREKMERT